MTDNNAAGDTPRNARSAGQLEVMREAVAEGRCMFCQIDLKVNTPINKQGEFDPEGLDWPLLWVWANPFPQEHHAHHIMIVPRRHFTVGLDDGHFTVAEWLQILDAWEWAIKFYQIPGGGFVCRFGDPAFNAGTVGHAHCQLQVPNGTGPVKATFFKSQTPEDLARRAARLNWPDKA